MRLGFSLGVGRGGNGAGRIYDNLLTYSNQYSNAAWTKAGTALTVTDNTSIAYDGTLTADTVAGSAAFQSLQQIVTSVSGVPHTLILPVSNSDRGIITLRVASGSNDVRKKITLATGAVADGGGNGTGYIAAGVQQVGSFYLCWMAVTTGGTSVTCNLYPDDLAQARTHTADYSGAGLVAGVSTLVNYAQREA